MAVSFGPETPLLNYGPRAHANPGGRNDRVWLAWPAWAFRVVAPEFRSQRLNALQRAVLGMLRASKLTASELGERLGVHRELAAFIVAELQGQEHVDEAGMVTPAGVKLLEFESMESANLIPGWVFRDALSGKVLPFVAPNPEPARTVRGDNGRTMLDLGSTGSPWQQHVWRLNPMEGASPDAPAPNEILRAASQGVRKERIWQQIGAYEDDEPGEQSVATVSLERLTCIEPEPQAFNLVTFLYVPRGDDADEDWHVCEFFGRGYDRSLRQPVIETAREDENFAKLLNQRLFRLTRHGDLAGLQRSAELRDRRAGKLLARVLTISIESHAVAKPLREMLHAYLEWRDMEDRERSRRRRTVMTECRRSLELLFADLASRYPLSGMAKRLSGQDKAYNKATLLAAAKNLKLDELPKAMGGVPQGQVLSVTNFGDSWRLRPLVVATLLRAENDETHPLALAAKRAPDLLHRIDRVAAAGGKAVHAADSMDGTTVERVVEDTLKIAGQLLDLDVGPLEEAMEDG